MKKIIYLVCFSVAITQSSFANNIDLLFCVESALLNNSEIRKARADFRAFKEIEDQSFSNLLPSVGISVSRSRVEQNRADGGSFSIKQNYITESDAITLRQPVYRPKLYKEFKKARQQVIAEELLLLNKEDTLKMKVAEIYLKLLGAYEEEVLLAKRMRLLNEQKKAATKSIEAGRGTITELAEINAASDKVYADLIRAKQNIRLELNELQFYTGEEIKEIKILNDDINDFSMFKEKSISKWEEEAVSNNYELKSKKERDDFRCKNCVIFRKVKSLSNC